MREKSTASAEPGEPYSCKKLRVLEDLRDKLRHESRGDVRAKPSVARASEAAWQTQRTIYVAVRILQYKMA